MSSSLPRSRRGAHRTGRSLRCDPKNGHILDDKAAMGLWTREYAKGFEPRV